MRQKCLYWKAPSNRGLFLWDEAVTMGVAAADKRVFTNMLDCQHRCDRCGGQAYVLAVLDLTPAQRNAGAGDELYFCRHHWLIAEPKLEPMCGLIVDETHRLFEHVQDDGHIN